MAHDSKGPTKGIWWEHVAPAAAFAVADSEQAANVSGQELLLDSCRGWRQPASTASNLSQAACTSASVPEDAAAAAVRVTTALAQHYQPLQMLNASLAALVWLQSPAGRAAFPSLAPGSAMP